MARKSPRLAVRGILICEDRLLLVNAWPEGRSALMCAPGGGVEPGTSLPDNLAREFFEEVGLRVTVGTPCLVNEFHDPESGFHQVEVFFRCALDGEQRIDPDWQDPERIVTHHIWATRQEAAELMLKPSSLISVAFDGESAASYDALEKIVM